MKERDVHKVSPIPESTQVTDSFPTMGTSTATTAATPPIDDKSKSTSCSTLDSNSAENENEIETGGKHQTAEAEETSVHDSESTSTPCSTPDSIEAGELFQKACKIRRPYSYILEI